MGLFKLNLHFNYLILTHQVIEYFAKKTIHLNENGFLCVGGPLAAGKELNRSETYRIAARM